MKSRAVARLRGIMFFLATAASLTCGGGVDPTGSLAVNAGSNGSVPAGAPYALSATFSDTAGQGPWSYEVSWGDGNESTGTRSAPGAITATHTYETQGNYQVTVTVTNQDGASGEGSIAVAVTDPVIVAAGDIGDCVRTGDNATGALASTIPGIVMPLGDNAYPNGTPAEYTTCYDPAWGAVKDRTRPVAGNHDYYNPGPTKNAAGYFGYFGAAAGDPAKGYYSFTVGSWFVVVLNTGTESQDFIAAGSTQEQWLRAELASHPQQCVLAAFHHPQFSTITGRPFVRPETTPLVQALYDAGADLLLVGHDHAYQRFKPMRPDGTADAAFGIRQIVVGTGGGEGLYGFGETHPNVDVRNSDTFGVLKLTLKTGGYDWQFVPTPGGSFTDAGSGTCHGRPS
jgi:PKD repeat protein